MFQLAKQTVGWGKQPSKAPAAGSAVGKRPYASNIAPSLVQSNLPPYKEAYHGGAARAPFHKTIAMEAAAPGAKKPRREQQEPQRSIGVLNQRTLEIAPAVSRGRQLQPHPQADLRPANCVAVPSASNKFSCVQSMFNELQFDMGQKEHAIQNLHVANEKLNKDRTMLSRALERGAHERAEMSAGCNKMKADMEKVETRAAALHKELSDAKNILMVLDERFEKTDSNVRSALEQKKRMSQRIADLKCQLVECKEASDKVAIELQKSQVEQAKMQEQMESLRRETDMQLIREKENGQHALKMSEAEHNKKLKARDEELVLVHQQHEETLALKGDEYSRMLGEAKHTLQEEYSAAKAKLLSENDELRKQYEELECSKRVQDAEALKILTELNDHKALVRKLNGTVATNEASMVDLDKQLLALKQQVEDGKAAAQQLTAKHDKEKAELVSSMEAERQLEQKQMQQISIKNDEELGKKVEEFKQAEAKLLLQNDANLKTLQDKLDANMDLSKQLQIQLNEREAKEKHLAEELATANEKVRESEAGLMALKEANDVAQCESQAHTEQLKQLTSEMEKLQKESNTVKNESQTAFSKISQVEFQMAKETNLRVEAEDKNKALVEEHEEAVQKLIAQLKEKDNKLEHATANLLKFDQLAQQTRRSSLEDTQPQPLGNNTSAAPMFSDDDEGAESEDKDDGCDPKSEAYPKAAKTPVKTPLPAFGQRPNSRTTISSVRSRSSTVVSKAVSPTTPSDTRRVKPTTVATHASQAVSFQETTTVTSMVPPPNKLPAGRQAIKKCSSFKASLASPTSPTLYHPDQSAAHKAKRGRESKPKGGARRARSESTPAAAGTNAVKRADPTLSWGTYGQAADKEEIDVFTFE